MWKGELQYLQEKLRWCFPGFALALPIPQPQTCAMTGSPWTNIQENKTLDGNYFILTSQLVGQYQALPAADSAAPDIAELKLWEEAEIRAGEPQGSSGFLLFFSHLQWHLVWSPTLMLPIVCLPCPTSLCNTQLYMKTFTHPGVREWERRLVPNILHYKDDREKSPLRLQRKFGEVWGRAISPRGK